MGGLRTMGMVILLERNSLYPYVGDRFVASHMWVANHRYGFPLERNIPPCCGSVWRAVCVVFLLKMTL